uniref:Exonuclease domain-containing protein n=1 Tax=Panagrolaimus sp. PS1159 TaxID=55785 RepID=A0AC35GWJ0_9BILA
MHTNNLKRKKSSNDGPPMKKKNVSKEPQIYLKNGFVSRRLVNCEFACLFQYCTLGGGSTKPQWCALRNFTGVMSSILFKIDCTEDVFNDPKRIFNFLNNFHQPQNLVIQVEAVPRELFFYSIFTISRTTKEMIRSMIAEIGDPVPFPEYSEGTLLRPYHFLCSMAKMAAYGFPLAYGNEFIPTKESYKMVSETSPIFILDCEMCRDHLDVPILTRISLIDENGKILLDTLVKPVEGIKDYCTPWSGITKESLEGVKTTLKDVQAAISAILPEDGILCGHSIHFDLIAMKMCHPFCIDVSLLFNITGNENHRTGLKKLVSLFLGENIQESKAGHCSVEDCKATLNLFNLKLSHGISYGNVALGFDISKLDKPIDKAPEDSSSSDDEDEQILQPKMCKECGEKFAMTCPILNCSCLKDSPKNCIKCLTKSWNLLPKSEIKEANFSFREALRDAFKWGSSSLIDGLDTPMNTVMCAVKNPKEFIPNPNKNCKLIDVSEMEASKIIKNVGCEASAHRFSVIELDLNGSEKYDGDYSLFDSEMANFINMGVMKNTLCAFVFTSKTQTVAYLKVKDSISVC